MTCGVCGGAMRVTTVDLPFSLSDRDTVIIKDVPVRRCELCTDCLIEDATFARVDELLAGASRSSELTIVRFTRDAFVTDAINRALNEIGDQKDEFVEAAAERVLRKTEW